MPEADSKQRHTPNQRSGHCDLPFEPGGITRAIRQDDSLRSHRENLFRPDIMWHNTKVYAAAAQRTKDVPFDPEVDNDEPQAPPVAKLVWMEGGAQEFAVVDKRVGNLTNEILFFNRAYVSSLLDQLTHLWRGFQFIVRISAS